MISLIKHIKLKYWILIILGLISSVLFISYLLFIPKPIKFVFANKDKVVLFAHRGQISQAPENTYESISIADSQGFLAVEIDIRHTRDAELVLFHDEDMKRMLGVDKKLGNEDFEDIEKRSIIWNNKESSSKVIKLEKAFQDFPHLYYYLDIKTPTNKNIKKIVSLIRKYNMEERVIVSHANFFKQIRFKILYSDIANALEGFNTGHEKWIRFIPKKLRPDFYSSFIFNTDKKQVDKLKELGLLDRKIAYDVNKDNLHRAIDELGLRYLIIDIDSIPLELK